MNLHVGNLAPCTTEKSLREAFEPHGAVRSVTLPGAGMSHGLATGPHRGFGFVSMPNRAHALAATAAIHQGVLDGQTVTVHLARPSVFFRRRS